MTNLRPSVKSDLLVHLSQELFFSQLASVVQLVPVRHREDQNSLPPSRPFGNRSTPRVRDPPQKSLTQEFSDLPRHLASTQPWPSLGEGKAV